MQDPAAVERGARIYDGTCAQFCHEAEPRVGEEVNLFDCQWRYGNAADEIFQITTSGCRVPGWWVMAITFLEENRTCGS